jgi:hypothetical protein
MKPTITHCRVGQTVAEYESYTGDKHAHVCVTDWGNGEGWDFDVNETGCVGMFQLTISQWTALKKAMKAHLEELP